MNSIKYFISGSVFGFILSALTLLYVFDIKSDISSDNGKNNSPDLTLEKLDHLEQKIDRLYQLKSDIVNNNTYRQNSTTNNSSIPENDTTIRSKTSAAADNNKQPINPNSEKLNTVRDMINNDIASNNFDLTEFSTKEAYADLSDDEIKLIIMEIIQKANNGQLSSSDIFK